MPEEPSTHVLQNNAWLCSRSKVDDPLFLRQFEWGIPRLVHAYGTGSRPDMGRSC